MITLLILITLEEINNISIKEFLERRLNEEFINNIMFIVEEK